MHRSLDTLCQVMNRYFAKLQSEKPQVIEKRMGESRLVNEIEVATVEYIRRNFVTTKCACSQELSHCFKFLNGDGKEERPVRFHLLDYWYNRFAGAQKYNRETFNPRPPLTLGSAKPNELNTYEGFTVAPSEKTMNECLANIQPWIDNIKSIWAKDNKILHEYIFNWFSHLIQRPWQKTRVALIVLGEKGATKGITVAPIVKLIGSHAVELTQGDHVSGNFNAVLLNTLLVIMNEATWGGNKSAQYVIRSLITDDCFALTKKGIDTKGGVRSYHN